MDPIPETSEIAEAHGIYLHVDAAFARVDPHKMGLALIPAGGILFRDSRAEKRSKPPSQDQGRSARIPCPSREHVFAWFSSKKCYMSSLKGPCVFLKLQKITRMDIYRISRLFLNISAFKRPAEKVFPVLMLVTVMVAGVKAQGSTS